MNNVSSNIFVVMVFYNPIEEDIKHAQMLSERYDGVVVDNSSSPSCESSMFSRFKYIANNENLGIAEAQNKGIVEALKDEVGTGKKVLIPRAQEAREILPEKLREQGHTVDVAPVYQTVAAEGNAGELKAKLAAGEIDLVTFTSSSTVTNLLKLLGGKAPLSGVKLACIGPVTAETARNNGLEPDMEAEEYTINGLVKVISEYFQ